uniref:Uncharacterized protein n=1 Tax=Anguilla anguilla TaxID=7936 RepID=A0A0E9W1F9_ANGAN
MYIVAHDLLCKKLCKSLWIKASAKCL